MKNAAFKSIRAAFEYQGQKCSALSRVYVPASLAEAFKEILIRETKALTMGDKFIDFMGPVISQSAFDRVSKYIQDAKNTSHIKVLAGGTYDDSTGYYIRPTVVESSDPKSRFMTEEIFGPFLCLYVYDDADFGPKIFQLIDETTEYALSGAVFAKDRQAIIEATEGLQFAAGNFYIKQVNNLQLPRAYILTAEIATSAQARCRATSHLVVQGPVAPTTRQVLWVC